MKKGEKLKLRRIVKWKNPSELTNLIWLLPFAAALSVAAAITLTLLGVGLQAILSWVGNHGGPEQAIKVIACVLFIPLAATAVWLVLGEARDVYYERVKR